jgi:protein-L-isoaspartate(D-aspartate) O-methyltransferase
MPPHRGTVAAAHDWGDPVTIMDVVPSHERSYERLCYDSGVPSFLLPLRAPADPDLRRRLLEERLERAIGVIYRPATEMVSHYFHAELPRQFDEYLWFDETRAVTALRRAPTEPGEPETFPFGV